jgi:hypothetical protein
MIKEVKDYGWSYIALTNKQFNGAIQVYKNTDGVDTAVCFNLHEAFIVSDENGLFSKEDIINFIIKDKTIDIEKSYELDNIDLVAWEEDGVVTFGEASEVYKLNNFEIKESIKKRLLLLSSLDKLVDLDV